MQNKINIRILLIASVALTVVSAGITYYNVEQKKRSTKQVIHTYEVIEKAREMLSLVQDLETCQRGYLLTGDSSFLEPFNTAWTNLDTVMASLNTMVEINPLQHKVFQDHLLPVVSDKKKNILQSFSVLHEYSKDSATSFVRSGNGKLLMDSTAYWVNRLIGYEEQQLVRRNENLKHVYVIGDAIRLISFSLIGLTSIFALIVIREHERVNRNLMTNLQDLNVNLEKKVHERTLQLEEERNNSIKLNEELQENLVEIKSLHSALLDANHKLVKLNAEKDHFLGVTTHDLKAPLVGIRGLLNLLKLDGENLTDKQRGYVSLMEDTCLSMQRLVTDLLDLKRIEQGSTPVNKRDVSIAHVLEVLKTQFSTWLQTKNIRLNIENLYKKDILFTDRDILGRILDNLMSNAIKFSTPGKQIIIQVYEKNHELLILITDEGPGIKDEEIDKLFVKFLKLSAQPTGGESSSGLGLSIVKELVHMLDGNIKVNAAAGGGSIFTVILPLDSEPE